MTYSINPHDIEVDQAHEIGPYTVKIMTDDSPENPWLDCDFMTPLIADGGERAGLSEYGGENLRDFFSHAPRAFVSRNWRKIAAILCCDERGHDSDARDNAAYDGVGLGEARADLFALVLSMAPRADRLDTLAQLYTLLGWPAESLARHGYSQGDSLDLLFVATPGHIEQCGIVPAKHDFGKDFKGDADTYAAWAFGDVYGYEVTDTKTGEHLDSCWGFYGAYWENDSVLGEACGAMDSLDTARKLRRSKMLKIAIQNRLPLYLRPEILSHVERPRPN